MFTGISGSNTVEIASTMPGLQRVGLRRHRRRNAARPLSASTAACVRRISWLAASRESSSFRGCRSPRVERRLERVPGEARALHADRKLPHAGQHRQLAEILDLAGRAASSPSGGSARTARAPRRRSRPSTQSVISDADAFEIAQPEPWNADVGDDVAVDLTNRFEPVAAERIVALGVMPRALEHAEVPRPPVVVEDDFLVEIVRSVISFSSARSISCVQHGSRSSAEADTDGYDTAHSPARAPARRCPRACCRSPSDARIVAVMP